MNKLKLFLLILFSQFLNSQSIIGAWEKYETNSDGSTHRHIVIFSEGFKSTSVFDSSNGKFISTNGGSWFLDGSTLTEKIEFDTQDQEKVGSTIKFQLDIKDNIVTNINSGNTWNRIDDGSPGQLNGAWLMSGRFRNGVKSTRSIDRPRKTMKILSGSRFQWIAYNTETRQFMGTGGGTYLTVKGKYIEQIEFFSRDDSRVGAKLDFEFKLDNGEWNHMGFSSKGDPIHEIWVRRK